MSQKEKIINLGCGPSKAEGVYGVDIHGYKGVDQIVDLNSSHWDLESDAYDIIQARHVIEHVDDIMAFMKEVHRIGRNGAKVIIETPHFTALDSWKDPTHRHHLSCKWYSVLTQSYLTQQVPAFRHIDTKVSFGNALHGFIPKLMIAVKGVEWWERYYAFVFQARNHCTTLEIVKDINANEKA